MAVGKIHQSGYPTSYPPGGRWVIAAKNRSIFGHQHPAPDRSSPSNERMSSCLHQIAATYARNPNGEWTNQHLMSVNGKFKDFVVDDLLEEANRFAVGTASDVIEQVRTAIKNWPQFAHEAGLPDDEMVRIQSKHLLLN
jgi:hypothetical protein